MTFDWLNKFHKNSEKAADYAEKTLAAYRLGMKAKGSIAGVTIWVSSDCCDASKALPENKMYHPDDAPHLPLAECPLGRNCHCVYRPVMSYQVDEE